MAKDCNEWSSFSDDRKMLMVHNQDTRYPWYNQIYNRDGRLAAMISQKGHGTIYCNYEQNLVSAGFDFFLHDGGECISLHGADAPQRAEQSSCEMYPGRTVYRTRFRGIAGELKFTLAPSGFQVLWLLSLKNESAAPRLLSLTAVSHTLLVGEDNTQQLDTNRFAAESNAVIMRRYHSECAPNRYAGFFAATEAASSWCGSCMDFVGGDLPFGRSASLFQKELPNAPACALGDPLTALRIPLELPPQGEKTVGFILGVCRDEEEAQREAARGGTLGCIEQGFLENAQFYRQLLESGVVQLPHERLDSAVNCWTRLQLIHQNLSGRIGAAYNWRNNLQDAMGMLHLDPAICRRRLVQLAALTQKDGFVPRSTLKGTALGDNRNALKQRHNDIGCWYALAAAKYLRETGDLALLDEETDNPFRGKITVGQAVCGGLIWILSNRGSHGLVLFKDGDWSDPLEKAGRLGIGESVWTSIAAIHAIREIVPLLAAAGKTAEAERLQEGADDLAASVERHAWDGDWYIRGITDSGVKFCTRRDPDAQVSMLVQAWALLAGIGRIEGRREKVLHSLLERCTGEFGPMLYAPPYLRERDGIGRESAKRPGCGENGSCYTHGAMMFAAAMLNAGRPDEALNAMEKVLFPMAPEQYATRCGSPLWWSNYLQSPYAAFPGRSSNIISSGAPAWLMMNVWSGFCGLRPELDGLHVAPQLPSAWSGIRAERLWRGSVYDVTVRRTGRFRLLLDGKPLDGNVIPVPERPGRHEVVAECP